MVNLLTNAPQYANDIAEVIRAYLGVVDVAIVDDMPDAANCWAVKAMLYPEGQNDAEAFIWAPGGRYARYRHPIRQDGSTALHIKRQEKRAIKIAVFRALRVLMPEADMPWGSLTGIRPTKLLRELQEVQGVEALQFLQAEFDVTPEKAASAAQIIEVQRPILASMRERDVDIYIGIPYCRTRCLYCSFASEVVGKGGVPDAYLDALFADIRMGAQIVQEGGYGVRCMYVGGGTPTVLEAGQLAALLAHARGCYGGYGVELTVEAGRPDSITIKKLQIMRDAGVNRISLNPQSMQAETLQRIGRAHTPEDIEQAFYLARRMGFDNINMDLIAGLPGENIADIEATLSRVASLQPESITAHTLALKRSSRLKKQLEDYPLPAAAEVAGMVGQCAAAAGLLGMRPYYMYRQKYMRGNLENVGYALPGKECIYNIDMMEEAVSILAHGAGAMTKRVYPGGDMRVERIPAPKDIHTYCSKLEALGVKKRELFLV